MTFSSAVGHFFKITKAHPFILEKNGWNANFLNIDRPSQAYSILKRINFLIHLINNEKDNKALGHPHDMKVFQG